MCGEGFSSCLIYCIHSDVCVLTMKFQFETRLSETWRDTEPGSVRQLPPKEGENMSKMQRGMRMSVTVLVKCSLDINLY